MNLPGTSKVPKVLSGNTPNDRDIANTKVGSCTATNCAVDIYVFMEDVLILWGI